ncbi:MAG: aldolase [Clostridiales bacterium]|nr:aldolase [Clostridiales bacterium]
MSLSYPEIREEMCNVARLMWERRLTNAAGGNMAVQVAEDRMLVTPSLMSERKHCQLEPKDLLLVDWQEHIYEGEGKLSRETGMHINLLKNFAHIGASIHAHPFWCMPFVSAGKMIPNVTEATMGRGAVGCIEYTKAYTDDLAKNVYDYFEQRHELAERKPLGVILPLHGVVVTGETIFNAYSMLERIECDALCNLTRGLVDAVPDGSPLG